MAIGGKNGATFDAAAKHLFRHLHDARSLRRNPLVHRFFARSVPERVGGDDDRLALTRIHALVKKGADRCRDADVLEGHDRRAARQHAIVIQQCLGQRSISTVANELGISCKQCYRQRAEICRRVARLISECYEDRILDYTPDVDTFRIALDSATHRGALIDARDAVRECEKLARTAPSAAQSIEALRVAAVTAMHFGDTQGTDGFYRAAMRIYAENLGDPSFGRVTARACIDLVEAKLAYYRADMVAATAFVKRAARGLRSSWQGAPERIKELYVESLYEMGATLCNSGDVDQGIKCLVEAHAIANRITLFSSRLLARITQAIWKLRSHLLSSSAAWRPASQRHRGLLSAFELAYGTGSFPEATAAAVALTEHHAFGGNDGEALRAARLALTLAAQQRSDRIRAQTSIELAMILRFTRSWAFGLSLLPDSVLLSKCDAYHRAIARYVIAQRALRNRRFEDAWILANHADAKDDFGALAVGERIVAANAAHRLGRRRDAQALIETIVPAAERLSLAPVLLDAYGAAARVTGETRFKLRVREVAKLLTE